MSNQNGFDDFDTQVTAEEFYAGWTEDEADYHADWRDEQVQEDVAPQIEEEPQSYWEFEDHMAQYDDDPNPYAGTYSEE